MNLITAILVSPVTTIVLGAVLFITGISDGLYLFIACGLVFIYNGFRDIHKL